MASPQATPELINALGALTTLVQAQGAMLMTVIGTQNDVIRRVSRGVLECNDRMDTIIPKLDGLLLRSGTTTVVPEEKKTCAELQATGEPEMFEEDTYLDEEEPKQPSWQHESDAEEEQDFDYDAFWGPPQDAWALAVAGPVEEESSTSVVVEEPLELPEETEQEAIVEQTDEEEQHAEEENVGYDAFWGPTGQDAFAATAEESNACEEEEAQAVQEEQSADVEVTPKMLDEEEQHAGQPREEEKHHLVSEPVDSQEEQLDDELKSLEEEQAEEKQHAGQVDEEKEEKHVGAVEPVGSLEEKPFEKTVAEEEEKIDYDLIWGRGAQDAFALPNDEVEAAQGATSSSRSDLASELAVAEAKALSERALQDKKAQQKQKNRARKDRHRQQKADMDASTDSIGQEPIPRAVPEKDDATGPPAQAAPTKPRHHHHHQKEHYNNGGAAHHLNGGPQREGFRGHRGSFGGPRGGGYGAPRAFNKTPRGNGASLASAKQLFSGRRVDANNNHKLQVAESRDFKYALFRFALKASSQKSPKLEKWFKGVNRQNS
ncbi:hypothetical protein AAVH_12205 [Aphelenchoides avenae]|nr:hypothetical protein AAVH_12205 [Aphelenchus avenae]